MMTAFILTFAARCAEVFPASVLKMDMQQDGTSGVLVSLGFFCCIGDVNGRGEERSDSVGVHVCVRLVSRCLVLSAVVRGVRGTLSGEAFVFPHHSDLHSCGWSSTRIPRPGVI